MNKPRLKGLVALVSAAVEHGSAAIEKIQLETAGRTFHVLEKIPPIGAPARVVHLAHDASVKTTHASIRLVNALAKGVLDVLVDKALAGDPLAADPPAGDPVPAPEGAAPEPTAPRG